MIKQTVSLLATVMICFIITTVKTRQGLEPQSAQTVQCALANVTTTLNNAGAQPREEKGDTEEGRVGPASKDTHTTQARQGVRTAGRSAAPFDDALHHVSKSTFALANNKNMDSLPSLVMEV